MRKDKVYVKFFKRLFDILISVLLLPIVLLIVMVTSVFIFLDDGFPIFYNSERRGKNGAVFKMYKLRSMRKNSKDLRNADGSTFNSENDIRLTNVGKVIRKLSIDELPQIFNVFLGDMSMIGPRPSIVSTEYEKLDELRKKRLDVLPGITGYTQAYFRNSISQEEKIEKDCWYTDNVSLFLDIKIVWRTIKTIIIRKNIYNN